MHLQKFPFDAQAVLFWFKLLKGYAPSHRMLAHSILGVFKRQDHQLVTSIIFVIGQTFCKRQASETI